LNGSIDADASNAMQISTRSLIAPKPSWSSNIIETQYNQQQKFQNLNSQAKQVDSIEKISPLSLSPGAPSVAYSVSSRSKSFSSSRSPSPSSSSSSSQLVNQVQDSRSCESPSILFITRSNINQHSNNKIDTDKTPFKHLVSEYLSTYFNLQQPSSLSKHLSPYYQAEQSETRSHNLFYRPLMSALNQEEQQQHQSLPPPPTPMQSSGSSSFAPRELSKLKRFLTTLQQFAADISPEIGERVRNLVHSLVV
jgi:hypothetical protein